MIIVTPAVSTRINNDVKEFSAASARYNAGMKENTWIVAETRVVIIPGNTAAMENLFIFWQWFWFEVKFIESLYFTKLKPKWKDVSCLRLKHKNSLYFRPQQVSSEPAGFSLNRSSEHIARGKRRGKLQCFARWIKIWYFAPN
jgi:hypothetical protein